ncbi:hypothetical protein F4805DRAFT_444512 [Annulohypoxylon moriforme]|nr:hypothetical protein F4805DRAFT_444512 [Annulohypoxylon moriforme]
MDSKIFDIIIVGGGTAGPVLASRLSEDPNLQVLLIEAGEDLAGDPRAGIPSIGSSLLGSPATNWGFETITQAGLNNRKNIAPSGRLLGGSSAVNGFAFLPNSESNVNSWASIGNHGWDWDSFSASMDRFRLTTTSQEKGQSPLKLTIPEEDSQCPRVWRDTLSKLGFPVSRNSFSGNILGSVTGLETIDLKKRRSHSANAYLNSSVRSRGNLTIWTATLAEKVSFDKASDVVTATGIQFFDTIKKERGIVQARREIIISAGAINSPRLLEISGIGNGKLLQPLGIDVIIDNPNVGENLQNHPMCTLSFEALDVDEEGFQTVDPILRKDHDAVTAAQRAYTEGLGPFSKSNLNILAQLPLMNNGNLDNLMPQRKADMAPSLAGAQESFVRSVLASPTEASGCYMTIPGFTSFDERGSPISPPPGKYFTIAVHLSHPLSRGSVHITSASPPESSSGISIDPKYFSHPLDLEVLARHVQLTETIAMTGPLSDHLKRGGKRGPGMPAPGGFSDIQTARNYVRNWAKGAHHWMGSCAMAPQDLGGVVDPELRVHGCANLRVCDASIIPIAARSDIQGVVYAIAEHGSQIIKSSLK